MASYFSQSLGDVSIPFNPPMLIRKDYALWNIKMESYIISISYLLWRLVKDGFDLSSCNEEEWSKEDLVRV